MKTILSVVISLLLTTSTFAETSTEKTTNVNVPTAAVKSSLDGSMYEIIGRADTDNIVLQLNKETGEVKFLSHDKYININRQETPEDVAHPGQINYQLIMSSNTVYLLNINTGTIWYMKGSILTHANDKFVLVEEK